MSRLIVNAVPLEEANTTAVLNAAMADALAKLPKGFEDFATTSWNHSTGEFQLNVSIRNVGADNYLLTASHANCGYVYIYTPNSSSALRLDRTIGIMSSRYELSLEDISHGVVNMVEGYLHWKGV